MADYHVDLNDDYESGTGSGDSETNRFGWYTLSAQFVNDSVSNGDVFLLRGFRETDFIFSAASLQSMSMRGWERNPWILSGDHNFYVNEFTIQDLVTNTAQNFVDPDAGETFNKFINTIFRPDGGKITITPQYELYERGTDFCGSTFFADTIEIHSADDSTPSDFVELEFDNCLFSATKFDLITISASCLFKNCVFLDIADPSNLSASSTQPPRDGGWEFTDCTFGVEIDRKTYIDPLSSLLSANNNSEYHFSAWNSTGVLSAADSKYWWGYWWMGDYTNDIEWGFLGTPRMGAGAFYFNGPYYVDLERVFSTDNAPEIVSGRGTIDQPFAAFQFLHYISQFHGAGETWFLKNSYDMDYAYISTLSAYNTDVNFTVDVWDSDWNTYGPWRIYPATSAGLTNWITPKAILKNGIMNFEEIMTNKLHDMYIDIISGDSSKLELTGTDIEVFRTTVVGSNSTNSLSASTSPIWIRSSDTAEISASILLVGGTESSAVYIIDGSVSAQYIKTNASSFGDLFAPYSSSATISNVEYGKYLTSGTLIPANSATNLPSFSPEITTDYGPEWSWSLAQGHIGAFYFGPLSTNIVVSAEPIELTLIFSGHSTSAGLSLTPRQQTLILKILNPTIKSFEGFVLDFSASPRTGTTPLEVEFTALPRFLGSYWDQYEITEYRWYFDYIREASTYESTTDINITHTFSGYSGQKFAIKLVAVVQPK